MLTITFARDGRTWYGCRRYRVHLGGADPESMQGFESGNVSVEEATSTLLTIIRRELAAGRQFEIVDDR